MTLETGIAAQAGAMETVKPRVLAGTILPAASITPQQLRETGLSGHDIAREVAGGRLIRLRRGRYARIDLHSDLVRAGKHGARLDCVSLLAAIGVFVHSHQGLHLQIEMGASRRPTPAADVVRHWRRSSCRREALAADIREALAQAVRCQTEPNAIATIDSSWHHRIIDETDVAAIFALLPARYQHLREQLDPRAESGTETLVRLLLRLLDCHFELQVRIRGVGRVDLVVDGWLIIECDSKSHHEGWAAQKRDRRRDLAAAALGYTTIRLLAEDILHRPAVVQATIGAALAHGGLHNSFDRAGERRARR